MRKSSSHSDVSLDAAERGRVFVVRLAPGESPELRGRVTHAASGAVGHFDSVADLEAFVRRVLADAG